MFRHQQSPSANKSTLNQNGNSLLNGSHYHSNSSRSLGRRPVKRLGSLSSASGSSDGDHDEEDSIAARRKVLEQLLCLSSHLAGSVVDFLMEEVERKILKDSSTALGRDRTNRKYEDSDSNFNELDDSVLDDTTDYDEDDGEANYLDNDIDEEGGDNDEDAGRIIGERIVVPKPTRGATSLSPHFRKNMRPGPGLGGRANSFGQQLNGGLRKANSMWNVSASEELSPMAQTRGLRPPPQRSPSPEASPKKKSSARYLSSMQLTPDRQAAVGILANGNNLLRRSGSDQNRIASKYNINAVSVGQRNSPSLLAPVDNEEEEEEEAEEFIPASDTLQHQGSRRFGKDIGPSKLSPRDVPKQLRHANSLGNLGKNGDTNEESLQNDKRIDSPPTRPASSRSPIRARPGLGRKAQSVRNITSMFENPGNAFARGPGPSEPGKVFGRGPGAGRGGRGPGLSGMRSNSVKNIMETLSKSAEEKLTTNPNEAPASDRDSSSPTRGVQRNSSGIRMQRMLEKKTLERTKSGGSNSSNGRKPRPARKNSGKGVERKWSGSRGGLRRFVERTRSGQMKRTPPVKRQFSFGDDAGTTKSSSHGMYAVDKITNQLSHDTRKQKRIFKIQNAMRKLKRSATGTVADVSEDSGTDSDFYDSDEDDYNVSLPLPRGIKSESALLFVDISGFTKLSQALKVEKLSKTINDYFQLIAEQVQAFDGDILKFAGDAVFIEWRATKPSVLNMDMDEDPIEYTYGGDGLGAEKSVITAAACAARIIDKCADYEVFDENGKKVTTLNLHCAIGFGEVIGVHLGSLEDRMEYFVIGDPIKQVADAMDLGKMGEVVASPQCLRFLEGSAGTEPKVILTKMNKFSNPKLMFVKRDKKKGGKEGRLAERLEDWELPALRSLQKLMLPYAHPVVVENQLFRRGYGSGKEAKAQERFTSEAEIRDVFTVFIQPIVSSSEVSGKNSERAEVLQTLHDIMVIANKELRKFKGHLRQYTVDDKGIVLIANFGLRGSTFPQMVERLAMPFATNVQHILKAKLNIDCKMGATYGKAYCGVVGGLERHEYALLGPSVNLAARLMGHTENQGFLVDEEVKRKASNRGYEALAPVKAKGYKDLVPIFQPMLQHRRSWGSDRGHFVGRLPEVKQILKFAEDLIETSESAKMVWVSAESGFGKSSLLAHATEQIQDLCSAKAATHVILCHVCSDADSLQPLSVAGPLCLDIIAFARRSRSESKYERPRGFDEITALAKPGAEKLPLHVLGACRDAEVPDRYIIFICHLLLANTWPVDVDETTRASEASEVARFLVTTLLQSSLHLDMICWAIDDISHADEVSWDVIQLLCQYACNVMMLLASRPVAGADMNISPTFWEQLFSQGVEDGSVLRLELSALSKDDLEQLVKKYAVKNDSSRSNDALAAIAKEAFVQSGGMPQLAMQILDRKFADRSGESRSRSPKRKGAKKNLSPKISLRDLAFSANRQDSSNSLSSASAGSGSYANIGEHMLHRMDILSPETRTHVNLGAILGPSFESLDVVRVMERYRDISDADKEEHCRSVLESLEQAAECGILEEDLSGAAMSMSFCGQDNFQSQDDRIIYRFTHSDWRRNILNVVLDSWKREMYKLLAEALEEQFDAKSRNLERAIRKLFDPFSGGRKKGKNLSVASELALKIGAHMTCIGKAKFSLQIYQRALDLWLKGGEDDGMVLVMEEEDDVEEAPEEKLIGEDLEYVAKLYVAMGRCSLLMMDKDKSASAFEACIDLLSDSEELSDRALLFPALCGRFYTLRLARKLDHEAELDQVYCFVEDAEKHKNEIHHLQALAVEAEIFGRNGDFSKALEACSDLQQRYDAAVHSSQLVSFYGEDYCAQTLGQSAGWHARLSKQTKALEVCDYIVEILPNLMGADVFLALYPVLWVLRDAGQASRSLELCRKYLPLGDGENQHEVTHFNPFEKLYKPVTMLLDLSSGTTESDASSTVKEYVDWVIESVNGEYDAPFNTYTGSVARNADSVTAEICLNLATYKTAFYAKSSLLSKASPLVRNSMKLTKYMATAHAQVKGFAMDPKYKNL